MRLLVSLSLTRVLCYHFLAQLEMHSKVYPAPGLLYIHTCPHLTQIKYYNEGPTV